MTKPEVALLAADTLTRTSMGESALFWILGFFAVVGAVGVVCAPKAVHAALFLAMTMVILAVLYIAQGAVFLGVVQVVVYTGAVMMLFLFVLMFIGVDSSESLAETLRGQRITAITAGSGFGVLLIAVIGAGSTVPSDGRAQLDDADNAQALAVLIFTKYFWAFELTGALLITSALGAMVLTHRERLVPRKSQRQLSADRFRPGRHPTPLPAPGIYARRNAVDVPGLLPDGSPCDLSVSRTLRRDGTVLTLLTTGSAANRESSRTELEG